MFEAALDIDMAAWEVSRRLRPSLLPSTVRTVWVEDSGALSISLDASCGAGLTFYVDFTDLAFFEVRLETRQILVTPVNAEISQNTIHHLLVDQIWPRLIAHGGRLVLHAAGISSPKGAILIVGPSGRGKSTLAASLKQRGFALLGDDAIVISEDSGDVRCKAVYQSLRLFPDSIATLFEQSIEQSRVACYTDKQNVHLAAPDPGDFDHRVRSIFFLSADDDHARQCVAAVAPADACMRLVEHSFWLDPTDIGLTAKKLKSASALANRVPAFQLDYPRDFSKLPELHAAMFAVLD